MVGGDAEDQMSKQIDALKLALEALEHEAETGNDDAYRRERDAIREALAENALDRMAENARELGLDYEPPCKTGSQCTSKCQQCEQPAQQELVDSAEKAGAYMEARLWEFIDMAAAWPEAKPVSRTWAHVMVYAPPAQQQEPVAWADMDVRGEDKGLSWTPGHFHKTPLYTTTPQRKPLTEKRIEELYSFWVVDCQDIVGFARAVERTVKGEA